MEFAVEVTGDGSVARDEDSEPIPLSVIAAARMLGVHPPNVRRALRSLEQKGLARRDGAGRVYLLLRPEAPTPEQRAAITGGGPDGDGESGPVIPAAARKKIESALADPRATAEVRTLAFSRAQEIRTRMLDRLREIRYEEQKGYEELCTELRSLLISEEPRDETQNKSGGGDQRSGQLETSGPAGAQDTPPPPQPEPYEPSGPAWSAPREADPVHAAVERVDATAPREDVDQLRRAGAACGATDAELVRCIHSVAERARRAGNPLGWLLSVVPQRLPAMVQAIRRDATGRAPAREAPISPEGGDWKDASIWGAVKECLAEMLSAEAYANWIARTRLHSFNDRELVVMVADETARQWIEQEYPDQVHAAIRELGLDVRTVSYLHLRAQGAAS